MSLSPRSPLFSEEQQNENRIEKILEKQKFKVFLDEEIETWEDDLNEIQKVVETKQLYSEELTAKIKKKQKE